MRLVLMQFFSNSIGVRALKIAEVAASLSGRLAMPLFLQTIHSRSEPVRQ
jgi:hypothetical protein